MNSCHTKIRLYKSNALSVLMFWIRMLAYDRESDEKSLESFHYKCLKIICQVFWLNMISRETLYKRAECNSIVDEIRKKRLSWLGHVFRMEGNSVAKRALYWTPPGKRSQGRPNETWWTRAECNSSSERGNGGLYGEGSHLKSLAPRRDI